MDNQHKGSRLDMEIVTRAAEHPKSFDSTSAIYRQWRADIRANSRDPKAIFVMTTLRFTKLLMGNGPSYRKVSIPAQLAYRFMTEFILGLEIRPKTRVGGGLTIFHGYGLVVHDHCIIGDNVTLRNGVTIGQASPGGGVPIIGDKVQIGANSSIIGKISVGANSIIGAGSVVVKDIPANCVAAGNPARVIRQISEENTRTS